MGTRLPGRGLLTVAMATALVGLAACGDPNEVRAADPTTTSMLRTGTTAAPVAAAPTNAPSITAAVTAAPPPLPPSTTTTLDPMPTLPALPDLPAPATALETGASWCPPLDVTRIAELSDRAEREQLVATATEGAGDYLVEHADDLAEPWFDVAADPPRLVVGVRRGVSRVRAALTRLVADPTHLFVCQARYAAGELLAWADGVRDILGTMRGGPVAAAMLDGGDGVGFTVRADRTDLAAQVRDRYGDAVAIRLGLQPYPPSASPAASNLCPWAVAAGPRLVNGLRATVVLASGTVTPGGELDAVVRVTNTGTTRADYSAGSVLTGFVVRAGTTEVVGVSVRGAPLTGGGGGLAPGESMDYPAIVGTTSCDPSLGAALPPGTYDVLVPVDESIDGPGTPHHLVSEPVTLTVTG